MEPLKSVCRVCLVHKVGINWNNEIEEFCGISYKDCYYKYTQLKEHGEENVLHSFKMCAKLMSFLDADCYPTNLCNRCAIELKNAYIFFEHALDSFKILQNTYKAKEFDAESLLLRNYNHSQGTVCDIFDNSLRESSDYYDFDDVICYSPVNDNVDTEYDLNEITYEQNCKGPLQIPLDQQPFDSRYIKILNSASDIKPPSSQTKDFRSFETTLELNVQLEINCSDLLKSKDKKSSSQNGQSLHKSLTKNKSKRISKKSAKLPAIQYNVTFERLQNSDQQISNANILSEKTETNDLEEQTNETSDEHILEVESTESISNGTIPSNTNLLKPTEILKSVAKSSRRKRGSELAEYLLFMQNVNGNDISYLEASAEQKKSKQLSTSEQNEQPSGKLLATLSEESIRNNVKKQQKQKEIMCQYCCKFCILLIFKLQRIIKLSHI